MEIKEKQRLITEADYKLVSEPREQSVKISGCQGQRIFCSLKCLAWCHWCSGKLSEWPTQQQA